MNDVYSQRDNFFNYRILDRELFNTRLFKNQITWSKEKKNGEEIDTWTNITLANTLDLEGDKGWIIGIRQFNENLVAFQEKAISMLLFNSRVQIPASDGVPIEISNGAKMQGSRYISNSIGCDNKQSIV